MLSRIRKAQESDKGFTLIELLVVVIISGSLSAIAIPTFLKQREKGWDKAVKSDLRNNALKMEEYLDDNGVYPGTAAAAGFKASDNVGATAVTLGSGLATGFCLTATSTKIPASATDVTKITQIQHFLSNDGKPVNGPCPAALP